MEITSRSSLRKYLIQRCHMLGCKTHTSIQSKRLISLATRAEQEDARGKLMPPCFGVRFAAPDDETCKQCKVQVMCLHMASNKTLLRAQAEQGATDVHTLASSMSIEPRSVAYMQKAAAALGTIPRQSVNSVPANVTPSHRKDDMWPRRFMRERLRHPYLERLPIGTVLRRPYDKRDHLVCVQQGYYEYDGERYPTLYDVALRITGAKAYRRSDAGFGHKMRAICNFSMRKFFWKSIDEVMPGL